MTSHGDQAPRSSYTENSEFWVKIIREQLDRYRSELTDNVVLEAIGPSDGLTILDAGCGEGYLSRLLAQQGAKVTGIDSCAALVQSARRFAAFTELDVSYYTGTVDELPIADGQCDVVVCNHLLNDLEALSGPFQEFARVTREGGRLVILMLHPCFYGAHGERAKPRTYPTPDEYFRTRTISQEFKVAGIVSPAKVTMWFRPLEEYVAELRRAGFCIDSLSEPHPSAEQRADPWWRENFVRPLFMLMVAHRTGPLPGVGGERTEPEEQGGRRAAGHAASAG